MTRRLPEPGQVWRHYKGGEYTIDRVVAAEFPMLERETISILGTSEEQYTATSGIAQGELVVFYRGETGLWVRAIGSFLAVLGDSPARHRFELKA